MIIVMVNELTGPFYPAYRMRVHKQAPETSLGAEVYHQAPLVIDAHACRIQRTWQKYIQAIKYSAKLVIFNSIRPLWSPEARTVTLRPPKEVTL